MQWAFASVAGHPFLQIVIRRILVRWFAVVIVVFAALSDPEIACFGFTMVFLAS